MFLNVFNEWQEVVGMQSANWEQTCPHPACKSYRLAIGVRGFYCDLCTKPAFKHNPATVARC